MRFGAWSFSFFPNTSIYYKSWYWPRYTKSMLRRVYFKHTLWEIEKKAIRIIFLICLLSSECGRAIIKWIPSDTIDRHTYNPYSSPLKHIFMLGKCKIRVIKSERSKKTSWMNRVSPHLTLWIGSVTSREMICKKLVFQ